MSKGRVTVTLSKDCECWIQNQMKKTNKNKSEIVNETLRLGISNRNWVVTRKELTPSLIKITNAAIKIENQYGKNHNCSVIFEEVEKINGFFETDG